MILPVQNSVDHKDMGTATSATAFFRMIGSSFGAAIFGAILTARLTHHIQELVPGNAASGIAHCLQSSASQLQHLSPDVLASVLTAFAKAFQDLFLYAIPFTLLCFVVALFLRETKLKTT